MMSVADLSMNYNWHSALASMLSLKSAFSSISKLTLLPAGESPKLDPFGYELFSCYSSDQNDKAFCISLKTLVIDYPYIESFRRSHVLEPSKVGHMPASKEG
jgi:hypothetical protein